MHDKDQLPGDPPCRLRACDIQDCLSKNHFDESKCRAEIDALYACCNSFYQREGDNAKSVCCPQASLLRLKMRQLADEKMSSKSK